MTAVGTQALPPPAATKPPSAAEIAADYIRTLVFTGVLRTGAKVPVDDIAEMLRMSRQPVRDALIELAHDGLVVVDGRRGTFVAAFGPAAVRDHYELYGLLQSFAARRAAERRDPAVVEQLRRLERAARDAPDHHRRRALMIEFNRQLNLAADNSRLRMVVRAMTRFTPGDFYLTNVPDAADRTLAGMRALVRAIASGDGDRAAKEAIRNSTVAGRLLIDHLHAVGVFDSADPASETTSSTTSTTTSNTTANREH